MTQRPPSPAPQESFPTEQALEPKPRGWFGSNWGWVLVLIGAAVVISAAVIIAVVVWLSVGLENSEPYKLALQRVRQNPEMVEALGAPIREGRYVTGSISEDNGTGTADLSFRVHGGDRAAMVEVSAIKVDDEWRLRKLAALVAETERRIWLAPTTAPSVDFTSGAATRPVNE